MGSVAIEAAAVEHAFPSAPTEPGCIYTHRELGGRYVVVQVSLDALSARKGWQIVMREHRARRRRGVDGDRLSMRQADFEAHMVLVQAGSGS